MTRRITGPRRAAFTMIELLVVILIIAVLAAILLPAVGKVRQSARRTTAISEISQMSNAIAAFKTKYRVNFIPSSIILREDGNYTTAAELASLNYLKQVWPHLPFGSGNNIDWNGDGSISNQQILLEGDQCLVFFLGGVPGGGGGFSSNPTNPASTTGRGAPFYEFPAARLAANGNAASGLGFLSFIDQWNNLPYLYYSAYGKKNGYQAGDCPTVVTAANSAAGLTWIGPYQDTPSSFFQPTGFQIISAGSDKILGVGGQLTKGGLTEGMPDADNMTNFLDGQLSGY